MSISKSKTEAAELRASYDATELQEAHKASRAEVRDLGVRLTEANRRLAEVHDWRFALEASAREAVLQLDHYAATATSARDGAYRPRVGPHALSRADGRDGRGRSRPPQLVG